MCIIYDNCLLSLLLFEHVVPGGVFLEEQLEVVGLRLQALGLALHLSHHLTLLVGLLKGVANLQEAQRRVSTGEG